jgi:pimeloyl-ACP methyl ester carboxylesterase
MLTPRALRLLAVAQTVGIDDLLSPGLWPPLVPADLFRPGADLGPLLTILAASDPAALRLHTPALIVQGSNDPITDPGRTDRITRSLSANGAPVDYHVYPGTGHFDVIAAAHTQNAQWLEARLADTPSRQVQGDFSR